jgi:nitroimidazol reductase NimA-like FMN-containing flavoprotein (pyridoxamine 5'-phosphate oxidase superfamily)
VVSSQARIRRHPERTLQVPDDAEAILAQALVAHVGIVDGGWPVVIPMTYLYQDGCVYLHGAPGSRLVKSLAAGNPVCIEATLVDGLIASKAAESHSINYRSVVCFGRGAFVDEQDRRRRILEAMIARYFPGRAAGVDYAPITEREDKSTRLVEVRIEAMSAKGRAGGPRGAFDDDLDTPGNAGIHPVTFGV